MELASAAQKWGSELKLARAGDDACVTCINAMYSRILIPPRFDGQK